MNNYYERIGLWNKIRLAMKEKEIPGMEKNLYKQRLGADIISSNK
jgi:hypothetical protein